MITALTIWLITVITAWWANKKASDSIKKRNRARRIARMKRNWDERERQSYELLKRISEREKK